MLEKINALLEKRQIELKSLNSIEKLPEWYQQYLGRKGQLTLLLKQLGNISMEERPVFGKVINELKHKLQESFELKQKNLRESKLHKELEVVKFCFSSS